VIFESYLIDGNLCAFIALNRNLISSAFCYRLAPFASTTLLIAAMHGGLAANICSK